MDLRLFLASFSLSCILLLLLPPVSSQGFQSKPNSCPEKFECGSLGPLKFPYTRGLNYSCGFCMLDCDKPSPQIIFPNPREKWFDVKFITNSTIKLHDRVLESHLKDPNCPFLYNISFPRSPSIAFTILNNITLFRCDKDPETIYKTFEYYGHYKYYLYHGCDKFTIYFRLPNDQTPAASIPSGCTSFQLPAVSLHNSSSENPELLNLLTAEFDVQWHISGDCYDCYHEGQTCRTDWLWGPHCVNAEKVNAGNKKLKIILGTVIPGCVSILIVLVVLLIWCRTFYFLSRGTSKMEKRLQDEYTHHLTESDSFNNINEVGKTAREPHDMKIFSFGSIMTATDDFSSENKLGEGGFGPVYKGKLLNGREIAVKRLSRTSGQGLVEFKNELILISKLQHTNLVRVLGCCIHGEEKMLIYEYMPNKSLDFFLFEQDKKKLLDWQKRFNIIEGIAQGLLYLHKYSRMRVIHRDLKASNVLLDKNMNPKIADFGMARIFKQNETEAITNRVVGTYGYMSSEYAMEGTFSVKSDVFSFGVLILEIVTGRKNLSLYNLDDHQLNLVGYTWMLWKEGLALDLKDPALGDSCDIQQLLRSIHVGLLCVQENAMDRPSMSDVISMLNNRTMPLLAPKQPAFFTGRRALDLTSSEIKSTGNPADNLHISANELSFSVLEAR